jgi:hypothetical protein
MSRKHKGFRGSGSAVLLRLQIVTTAAEGKQTTGAIAEALSVFHHKWGARWGARSVLLVRIRVSKQLVEDARV